MKNHAIMNMYVIWLTLNYKNKLKVMFFIKISLITSYIKCAILGENLGKSTANLVDLYKK